MESSMAITDAVCQGMTWTEFGIRLIKTITHKFTMSESKSSSLITFLCMWICMRIPKRKGFSCMDAKIKPTPIFVDRFLSYFGRMCQSLTTINVVLISKREGKELQEWMFGKRLAFSTVIRWNIHSVDQANKKCILLPKTIVKLVKTLPWPLSSISVV